MIDERKAIGTLNKFLSIEGLSGDEGAVSDAIRRSLLSIGCRASWIRSDKVHKKIGCGFKCGNLMVKIPGDINAPRRLFMGHMDTVPLCRGAAPLRKGQRIVAKRNTALGADNRTSIACILTMVETLLKDKLPHPPITLLFTVGEEVGLYGARYVSLNDLGKPALGFNIDSGAPAQFLVGAIGATRWTAEIHGRSAHAGMHPEHGISAALIAAKAINQIHVQGLFGKIVKGKRTGTSNIGHISGGEASNQVTEKVIVSGECRSHSAPFLEQITRHHRLAFERAAASAKNHRGVTGKVTFKSHMDYPAFRMKRSESCVRLALRCAKNLGYESSLISVNGGLDANYMNHKGLPTVTLGAGQHGAHTLDEYVDIQEYLDGCRLCLELATATPAGI